MFVLLDSRKILHFGEFRTGKCFCNLCLMVTSFIDMD